MSVTLPHNPAKMRFIAAYFDELDRKINVLSDLAQAGFDDEALTLCLVYIDGLAQWLCWPSKGNGLNFTRALAEWGKDPELALIHPLQLAKVLGGLQASWHPIGQAVRTIFPGPPYQLVSKEDLMSALGSALTGEQINNLKSEIWRGTLAAIAYYRMRNPAVHALGTSSLSFSETTSGGQPVPALDFLRLQRAAKHIAAEAHYRSELTGNWFGQVEIFD